MKNILLLLFGLFCLANCFMITKFVHTEYNIPIETLTKEQQDAYYGLIWMSVISFIIALPLIIVSVKFILRNKKG